MAGILTHGEQQFAFRLSAVGGSEPADGSWWTSLKRSVASRRRSGSWSATTGSPPVSLTPGRPFGRSGRR